MIRAKPWNGQDLKGTWEVTLKIDGIRALWVPANTPTQIGKQTLTVPKSGWYSRACKPLLNIPPWRPGMPTDCEVYLGPEHGDQKARFKASLRATRTKTLKVRDGCSLKKCKCTADDFTKRMLCPKWETATPVIHPDHLYGLDPLDERLRSHTTNNPSASHIRDMMERAVENGYEGLVLRQGDVWLKVKPEETHDVLVTGAIEGEGKHKGRLGALMTAKGKVGTGFSDEEREELWSRYCADLWDTMNAKESVPPLIGSTVEVACMSFTPDGKFRHPRFVRMRPDKIAEE